MQWRDLAGHWLQDRAVGRNIEPFLKFLTQAWSYPVIAALVQNPDSHAEVLGLARRDAERVTSATVADLVALARGGRRVARLVTGSAWRTEQAALEALGVETEVLPISR